MTSRAILTKRGVTFRCTGSDSNFYTMLDDLAAQYPSVQLVSFSIDTRSFADTDGSAVTANTAFNCIPERDPL